MLTKNTTSTALAAIVLAGGLVHSVQAAVIYEPFNYSAPSDGRLSTNTDIGDGLIGLWIPRVVETPQAVGGTTINPPA